MLPNLLEMTTFFPSAVSRSKPWGLEGEAENTDNFFWHALEDEGVDSCQGKTSPKKAN